jgi:hypothetical protein
MRIAPVVENQAGPAPYCPKRPNRRPRPGALPWLGIALALSAPQARADWERLPLAVDSDYTWGASFYGKGNQRMASDDANRLYLSLGNKLLIGTDQGNTWATAPIGTDLYGFETETVGAAGNGLVAWGTWLSRNGGRTWDSIGSMGSRASYAIDPKGVLLVGGSVDGVDRSPDFGKTWKSVHSGNTFGYIRSLMIADSGWAFAAPLMDGLLISRNGGVDWTEYDSLPGEPASGVFDGPVVRVMDLERKAGGDVAWMVKAHFLATDAVMEVRLGKQGPVFHIPANAHFPDSEVSCIKWRSAASASAGSLWIGTWGQGVFVSHDRGESWSAQNAGMKDLHVEAMVATPDGWIFALTPEGLFRLTGSGAAISRPRERKAAQSRLQNNPGAHYLIDGRRLPEDAIHNAPAFLNDISVPWGRP